MRELSAAEQRYQAVLAVIKGGRTVTEVAAAVGSRQTLHAWLVAYEAGGLEGLGDDSHRPTSYPRQMSAAAEVVVLEARRAHPAWGPQRIAVELGRRGITTSKFGVLLAAAGGVGGAGRAAGAQGRS